MTESAYLARASSLTLAAKAGMYGLWEGPHCSTGSNWIYADASVHRVISALAVFIGRQSGHRVLAAGDLNILHGYGDHGSPYWRDRYATVYARMASMGVPFAGPQAPNGRLADPWPAELRHSLHLSYSRRPWTCHRRVRKTPERGVNLRALTEK